LIPIYEKHLNQEKVAHSLVNCLICPNLDYFEECSTLIELWLNSSFQSLVDQLIAQFDPIFFLKWSHLYFVAKSKAMPIFPMIFSSFTTHHLSLLISDEAFLQSLISFSLIGDGQINSDLSLIFHHILLTFSKINHDVFKKLFFFLDSSGLYENILMTQLEHSDVDHLSLPFLELVKDYQTLLVE
jgi:hypothetical protein